MPSSPTPLKLGDFGPLAQDYARTRPGYPADLVDQLLAVANVRPGDHVADLGAGTGLFTRLLSGRGLHITALDPSAPMLAQAPALPDVAWRESTFEHTGLPDASQRWLVAAQAFHWADPPRALPELRRVLLPAGHLTILWNTRLPDRCPVQTWVYATLRQLVPGFSPEARDHQDWSTVLTSTGDFTNVRTHTAQHLLTMSAARFTDLWKSHNSLTVAAGPDRLATFLHELQNYLSTHHVESITVVYETRAWTAQRT